LTVSSSPGPRSRCTAIALSITRVPISFSIILCASAPLREPSSFPVPTPHGGRDSVEPLGREHPSQEDPCDSCASLWLLSRGLLTSASRLRAPRSVLPPPRDPASEHRGVSPVMKGVRDHRADARVLCCVNALAGEPIGAPRRKPGDREGAVAPERRRRSAALQTRHRPTPRRRAARPSAVRNGGPCACGRGDVAGRHSHGACGPSRVGVGHGPRGAGCEPVPPLASSLVISAFRLPPSALSFPPSALP
jgi:hypothetical protein